MITISTTTSAAATAADISIGRNVPGRQDRAAAEQPDKRGEQREHGHQIERPFHHDRGKHGGAIEPFGPGHQVRTNQIAGARGQQRQGGKAKNRGAQDGPVPGGPDRVEQIAPADGTEQRHRQCQQHRPRDQIQPRPRYLTNNRVKVRATEEPREKGNRQKRYQDGTNTHSRGPEEVTQYIRLLVHDRQ
jgi:hypothetical protein